MVPVKLWYLKHFYIELLLINSKENSCSCIFHSKDITKASYDRFMADRGLGDPSESQQGRAGLPGWDPLCQGSIPLPRRSSIFCSLMVNDPLFQWRDARCIWWGPGPIQGWLLRELLKVLVHGGMWFQLKRAARRNEEERGPGISNRLVWFTCALPPGLCWCHEMPLTASQCKQDKNHHIFPVKDVSDTLTGKYVPSFSVDHQKGRVSVLTDPRKGQGKCQRRLYLANSWVFHLKLCSKMTLAPAIEWRPIHRYQ